MITIEMKDRKQGGWRFTHVKSGMFHVGSSVKPLCERLIEDNPKRAHMRAVVVNAKTGAPRYWISNLGIFTHGEKSKPLPDLFR